MKKAKHLADFIVHITRTTDGATRSVRHDFYNTPVDATWRQNEYWWTDGNFGCDCNRFLEFERAAPDFVYERDDDALWDRVECGEGAYTIRVTEPSGGVLYYENPAAGVP